MKTRGQWRTTSHAKIDGDPRLLSRSSLLSFFLESSRVYRGYISRLREPADGFPFAEFGREIADGKKQRGELQLRGPVLLPLQESRVRHDDERAPIGHALLLH